MIIFDDLTVFSPGTRFYLGVLGHLRHANEVRRGSRRGGGVQEKQFFMFLYPTVMTVPDYFCPFL